jgi:hypothetical protein
MFCDLAEHIILGEFLRSDDDWLRMRACDPEKKQDDYQGAMTSQLSCFLDGSPPDESVRLADWEAVIP